MKHGTLVVVADGEKALYLRNQGDEDYIDLRVSDVEQQENPPNRDQVSDRPGRYRDNASSKSAVEQADWHTLAEAHFAHDVAERLNGAALKNGFDHLVIVAPPRTMGEIRGALHQQAREKVVSEITKDLTNRPVWEIEKLLSEG